MTRESGRVEASCWWRKTKTFSSLLKTWLRSHDVDDGPRLCVTNIWHGECGGDRGEREESLPLHIELITTRLQYFRVCVFVCVCNKSVGLQQSALLLFGRIFLACFLPFEDRVLALHVRPAQRTVGQIANDHWQLADLTAGKKNKTNHFIQSWG